jgi:hypothetical protein
VYELYADYALKNPFYSLEMPIREAAHQMFGLDHSIMLIDST